MWAGLKPTIRYLESSIHERGRQLRRPHLTSEQSCQPLNRRTTTMMIKIVLRPPP
jgi:hypothetical protein